MTLIYAAPGAIIVDNPPWRPPVALPPGKVRTRDPANAAGDVARKEPAEPQFSLFADPGHGIT